MRTATLFLALLSSLLLLAGCAGALDIPLIGPYLGGGSSSPTETANALNYDGAITLSIKNGQTLPGTNLGYQGKSADGRALLLVGPEQAAKSTADSLSFTGVVVPGTTLKLDLRIGPYDNSSVTLLGFVHITVDEPQPAPGDASPDVISAYGIQVQYTVPKNSAIPGTNVVFLGQTPSGAQFSGAGQYPYRQQLDSVVWSGHLRAKVFVRYDLRLIAYSEDNATLVGGAQVKFEK